MPKSQLLISRTIWKEVGTAVAQVCKTSGPTIPSSWTISSDKETDHPLSPMLLDQSQRDSTNLHYDNSSYIIFHQSPSWDGPSYQPPMLSFIFLRARSKCYPRQNTEDERELLHFPFPISEGLANGLNFELEDSFCLVMKVTSTTFSYISQTTRNFRFLLTNVAGLQKSRWKYGKCRCDYLENVP